MELGIEDVLTQIVKSEASHEMTTEINKNYNVRTTIGNVSSLCTFPTSINTFQQQLQQNQQQQQPQPQQPQQQQSALSEHNILQYLLDLEENIPDSHNNSSSNATTNTTKTCPCMFTESRSSPATNNSSSDYSNSSINDNVFEQNSPQQTTGSTTQSESSDDDEESNEKKYKRMYKFNPKPLISKPSMRRNRHRSIDTVPDPEYLEKRKKNNEASRRSRLARRYKECLIVEEMKQLRKENEELKEQLRQFKAVEINKVQIEKL